MEWGRHNRHSTESAQRRFLAKTRRTDSGCLQWVGGQNGSKRYGTVSIGGKQMLAHRAAYMLFVGNLTDACVCHRCDNGFCVEPSHLFLGSQHDNILDMEAKGRSKHPSGAQHGRAKLTEAQVDEIRTALTAGQSGRSLAIKYGVAKGSVYRIKHGLGWLPREISSGVVMPD